MAGKLKPIDRRRARVRRALRKRTNDFPRLSVFRSNQNIYAQIIDDLKGVTLAAAYHGTMGADQLFGPLVTDGRVVVSLDVEF